MTTETLKVPAPAYVMDLFLVVEIVAFGMESRIEHSRGALRFRSNNPVECLSFCLQAAKSFKQAETTWKELKEDKTDHVVKIAEQLSTAWNAIAAVGLENPEMISACWTDVKSSFENGLLRNLVPGDERALVWPPALSEGEMTRKAAAAPKLSKLNVAIEVAEIIGRQDEARAMHIASSVDQVQRTILAFNAVYGEALPLVSMGGRNVVFENKVWQSLSEVDAAVRALRGYDVGTQSSEKAFKEQIAQAKAELDKARIGFACCCISHGISWCR